MKLSLAANTFTENPVSHREVTAADAHFALELVAQKVETVITKCTSRAVGVAVARRRELG